MDQQRYKNICSMEGVEVSSLFIILLFFIIWVVAPHQIENLICC